MEKRQALIGGVAAVVVLAAGGFWWFTQSAGEAPQEEVMVVKPKPAAPAQPPAPVVVAPAAPAAPAVAKGPESDAVALSEEEVDRIKAESADLAARAADLEEQVKDGNMIVDAQAKKIAKLEEELKKLGATPAPPKKP